MEGSQYNRRFTFDGVFDQGSTQEEVFRYSGIKGLVELAIEGYSIVKRYSKRRLISTECI